MAYIGKSPSQGVRNRFQYQATAGQDSFSSTDANGLTLTYTDSLYMDVYQNGILLVPGDDYTATTGTTVVLVQSASLNDIIEMVVYDVFSVPDAVSQSAGGTFSGNVTMGNNLTVNSDITIGDASAADKKILFDGNAVDYHIGLDDSADSLIIGKGSALGTTTSMAIDANGIITKPLQPAFMATQIGASSVQSNIASDSTLRFEIERFDNNGDFTASTGDGQGGDASNLKGQFTAPVTGKYQMQFHARFHEIDISCNWMRIQLVTSNHAYGSFILDPNFSGDLSYYPFHFNYLVDMDAGDTASILFELNGGAAQMDASEVIYFSGYLVA